MCDDNSSESDGIFGFYIAIFSSFLFFFFSFQSKRIIPRWRYGRVTRKAALFRPFRNPLSDFPSVWCAATPSPSLEHWVLSIFHAILSTPVSLAKRHHRQSSFPGCGSWICEIGKLSVSLLSLPLLRFTLSSFPPVFFFIYTEGQRDNRVLGNIRKNTSIRDDILFLPVSIFNCRRSTSTGKKISRYLFQKSLDGV